MKIVLTLLLLCILVLSSMELAQSWSNGGYSTDDPSQPKYGTHDWIAQHALDWLPTQEKQYITDNLAAYLYGTELPDNNNASAPGHIGDTTKHHIYYWSNGTLQDDAAAVRASTEYQTALNFLNTGDYADAAETAGIMSHYIVDVAVFAHVMGASTDWGAETGNVHSNYEPYVETRTSSYIDTYNQYLSFDGNLQNISAYDAAKNLAFDTTFDHGGTFTCVWMNNNYNISNPIYWNRAGESLNLAVNTLTDVLHTLYINANTQPTPTPGPTQISGIISSDTTWTQIGSPYNLTGNVLVNNGVTLAIQPGAIVNLNGYYIMVNGTLQAWGNYGNPDTFNGGQITFTQYSTGWNASAGSGSIIVLSVLSSSVILNSSPLISNNIITGGISVNSGMANISNNTILLQGISLGLHNDNTTISNNIISGCSTGITTLLDGNGSTIIQGNLIVNNTDGIDFGAWFPSVNPIVQNNTITNNTNGISIGALANNFSPIILNNNIFSNINYNIITSLSYNTNATYNWWGTTSASAISQTIYDFNDDFYLGTVNFVPFLNAPNPATPQSIFNISSSTGAGGSITPLGIISVYYGGSQNFNITANVGYHITDVAVDGVSQGAISSYTFTNVQAVHTIDATFAINTYAITVTQTANGNINPGTTTVNYGATPSFSITPNPNYYIASITANGASVAVISPSGQTYQFSVVSAAGSLAATYAINTYTITVTQTAYGQIAPGTSTVNYGATPSFTITPNAGYHIAGITANGASVTITSPSGQFYQFNAVIADGSLTATFAINTYTITVTQTANGNISPATTTVNHGDSPAFTVTSNSGYYIASITTDTGAVTVTSPSVQIISFSNVQAPHTITATYAQTPLPTPTPTPVPTAAPTSTPTSASAPTPTPEASSLPNKTPTPTPTVLEFPSVIIVITLLFAATAATLFFTKKPKN